MRRLVALLALTTVAVPSLALAAPPKTFCELVGFLVNILNAATAFFVLAALLSYLYGIMTSIHGGAESHAKLRNIILWGLLGLFVMVSVWGILRILQETLFDAAPGGTVRSDRTC